MKFNLNIFLAFSFLIIITTLHFEAVLALDASFLREGARLKIYDLLSFVTFPCLLVLYLLNNRLPKLFPTLLLIFALLFAQSLLGPSIRYANIILSGFWMMISISTALFIYSWLFKLKESTIKLFLTHFLNLSFFIYILAFFDYGIQFLIGKSLIPKMMDFRQHQFFTFPVLGTVPRFEGFATLSLGFVSLGYFLLVLSIYLKKNIQSIFFALLLLLSMSIGAYVAILSVLAFFVFFRLKPSSKLYFGFPLVFVSSLLIIYFYYLKIITPGGLEWSLNVRQQLFEVGGRMLFIDPFGLGFGQSRNLLDFISRYDIYQLKNLYAKLIIEKTIVVESSHLELIYEFGWTGVLFLVFWFYFMFQTTLKVLKSNSGTALFLLTIPLFFLIHGFFTASYFFQLKFWLFNLISFGLINLELRKLKLINPA